MGLLDTSMYGRQQNPDLMGALQQGVRTRGLMRQDQAEQQAAQRKQAFAQAFDQASQGKDLTNPENMGNVLKQTFQQFPEETAATAEQYQKAFPQPKATEYGIYESESGPMQYDKANPGATMKPIQGVGSKALADSKAKTAKEAADAKFAAEKEAFDQNYKNRQLKQAGDNITKDNELATAKAEIARQKTEAEMARKAVDVDEVAAQADAAVTMIDQMIGSEDNKTPRHPGFKGAVGAKGMSSLWGLKDKPIAGTDEAGFAALYEQVKGGAFLEAVQKMKGSGALSDTEGKAAANAITRMQTSTSEAEFEAAAKEFRTAIKNRKGRVMDKAAAKAPGLIVTPHAQGSTGWTQTAPGIRIREKPQP